MKTIYQYLLELPEPYRKHAILNTEPCKYDYRVTNASNAIIYAFRWSDTEQGSEYWRDFAYSLKCRKPAPVTMEDQLKRLPEPYRSLALAYAKRDEVLDVQKGEVNSAVSGMYIWDSTAEGHDFWKSVRDWAAYHLDGYKSGYAPELPSVPKPTMEYQLKRLPEPYRTLALDIARNKADVRLQGPYNSVSGAVINIACWKDTEQGHKFWDRVHDWAIYNLDNDPCTSSISYELPPVPGTMGYQLNRLPEPYRSKALANAGSVLYEKVSTVGHSLQSAFTWSCTPEGDEFWHEVYLWAVHNLDTKKYELPPVK